MLIVGGLGLAATFVCPDPIDRIRYTFHPNLAHPIQRILVEMQPTYAFLTRPPYNFAMIYLLAGLVLVSIVLRFRHYRMWELAYLAALTLLANVASRSAMDWHLNLVALGVPHLCILWKGALAQPHRNWVRPLVRIDQRLKRMLCGPLFVPQRRWLVGAIALFGIVSVIPPLSRPMPQQTMDEWPVGAAQFMERNGLAGNVFAAPDLGAYLGWHSKGQTRSYTDTRTFFFPPHLVEDCHHLLQLDGAWQPRLDRVLNEFATDYLLLETDGARGALWQKLQPHISEPLYRDERTTLLSAAQVRQAMRQLTGS